MCSLFVRPKVLTHPHPALDEFRRYCDTVEKTAEWGGEPEVRYSPRDGGNSCLADRRARAVADSGSLVVLQRTYHCRPGRDRHGRTRFRLSARTRHAHFVSSTGLFLSRSTVADLTLRVCGTKDITARCTVSESTTTRCGRRRTVRRTSCRRRLPRQIRSVSGSSQFDDLVQPRPGPCRQTRRVHLQARMFWKYLFAVQQSTPTAGMPARLES